MATIRASCAECGDVELTTADVRVRVCTADNQGTYAFRCPVCLMTVVKPAEPRTVDLLVASGVTYETWAPPLELSEPRGHGRADQPRRAARLPRPAERRPPAHGRHVGAARALRRPPRPAARLRSVSPVWLIPTGARPWRLAVVGGVVRARAVAAEVAALDGVTAAAGARVATASGRRATEAGTHRPGHRVDPRLPRRHRHIGRIAAMFNVGPEKLMVVLLIALIVLGPDKLPNAARQIGKYLDEFRRISQGFQQELRSAMDVSDATARPPGWPRPRPPQPA